MKHCNLLDIPDAISNKKIKFINAIKLIYAFLLAACATKWLGVDLEQRRTLSWLSKMLRPLSDSS